MTERTPAYIPEDRIQNIEFSVDSLDSVLSDLKDGFSGLDRPTCHSCKHEIVEKEKLQVKTRVNAGLIVSFFTRNALFVLNAK